MRRLIPWCLTLVLAGAFGCQKEIRDDDTPTSSETSQAADANPATADALATAEAWIQAEERIALTDETRPVANSWKETPAVVLRVFRDQDVYFALVGVDSSDRVVPAILLKLDSDTKGWSVTETRMASSDFLWPSI